jgi:hypothetical protein
VFAWVDGDKVPRLICRVSYRDAGGTARLVAVAESSTRPIPCSPRSPLNMQLAIVGVKNGPGLGMHLNELIIEAGCAASHGVDLGLLTKIYMEFDRLRLDAKDPLEWTELMDAGHARENC